MQETSVFDSLVDSLSTSERRDMLDRLEGGHDQNEESVVDESPDPDVDLEEEYHSFGFFRRLLVFFRRVFGGKDRDQAVEEILVRDLGRRVQTAAPGMVDIRNELLLPAFYHRIKTLATDSSLLSAAIKQTIGNRRAEFLAFLCGLRLPEFQAALLRDTDPYRIAEKEPEASDTEIKKRMRNNTDEIFLTMSPGGKRSLYGYSVLQHRLMEFSAFRFRDLLDIFEGPSGMPTVTPIHLALGSLRDLDALLAGLKQPPAVFLEALVLFGHRELLAQNAEQIEGTVSSEIDRLKEAFGDIRDFAAAVPLRDIIRYGSGSINYKPEEHGGGEDWLNRLRKFWDDRTERMFKRFSYSRQRKQLTREIASLTHQDEIPAFPNYRDARGLPGRYAYSLSAVDDVVGVSFQREMVPSLRMLLLEGEFYKGSNRAEFDAAFSTLNEAQDKINGFRSRMEAIETATEDRHESESAPNRGDGNPVDKDVEAFMKSVLGAFRSLSLVVDGILYGQVGGKYDTISNLAQIGGRANKEYRKSLDHVILLCNNIYEQMGSLFNLESLAETSDAPEDAASD